MGGLHAAECATEAAAGSNTPPQPPVAAAARPVLRRLAGYAAALEANALLGHAADLQLVAAAPSDLAEAQQLVSYLADEAAAQGAGRPARQRLLRSIRQRWPLVRTPATWQRLRSS